MVDCQVSKPHRPELDAEEVEVEDRHGVWEPVGDRIGETILIEPLVQEIETVTRPGAHWEGIDVVMQQGFQSGNVVTKEFLVGVDLVARCSALESDDRTLDETARKEWLKLWCINPLGGAYLLKSSYVAIGSKRAENEGTNEKFLISWFRDVLAYVLDDNVEENEHCLDGGDCV